MTGRVVLGGWAVRRACGFPLSREGRGEGRAGSAGVPPAQAALGRGDTLALSHEGRGDPLAAVCTWFRAAGLAEIVWIPAFAGMAEGERAGWERGRPARRAALARGGALTLALSHEGRGDPLAAVCTWFRAAGLAATVWIPAFAGMTGAKTNSKTYPCKPIKGEGIRWLGFGLGFGWRAWLQASGFPLSRE